MLAGAGAATEPNVLGADVVAVLLAPNENDGLAENDG